MMKPFFRRVLPPLPVAPKLLLALVAVGLYSLLVSLFFRGLKYPRIDYGEGITLLNGIVLGVLLVFRNNAAYDRWWEGRKLWGQLINDIRNFSIGSRALAAPDREEAREMGRALVGFAHALRLHLRGGVSLDDVPGFKGDARRPAHVPAFLSHLVHERLARWRADGRIDGFALQSLVEVARGLMDTCGACERIRNTPLAYSYRALLRHGTLIYTVIAPVYTVRAFGAWGIPVLLLVFYFLTGVEIAAEDIEDPFGYDGDDLTLDAYCRVVESSVAELLLAESGEEAEARAAAEGISLPYGPSRPPEPAPAHAS
jgi:putative membrane protein